MKARGFVFQASYRLAPAPGGARVPEVLLYGRLEDGRTILVRDDGQRPHFYIRAEQALLASDAGAPTPLPTSKRTFAGDPVARIDVATPPDVTELRTRLHAAGVETFEADVRFAVRYLIDRGIKGGCEIEGEPAPGQGVSLVFANPELRSADVKMTPSVLSFDIETDAKGERLLAISLYAPGVDEVLIVDPEDRPMPERARRSATERAALDAFCARVAEIDPDVLTGWNTIDFDLTVLARIAERLRHPFRLGRDAGQIRIRKAEGYFGSGQANVPGRLVLDGIDLLRGAFVRMDDYSLDAVAREVLGEGKALRGVASGEADGESGKAEGNTGKAAAGAGRRDARDRIGEIQHNYRHDLPAFALYARTDARLAYEIVERLNLIPLAFARTRLSGMTPDRVAASIASFDFLYLGELRRVGLVAPTVRSSDSRVFAAQQGGHVLEPVTGLHRNVWVFDFKSLYPSIIRTFNIDPVSYVAEPEPGADVIETPGGAFRRAPAILPRLLDELFPRREAAKQAGDGVAAHAIKILMNSFYGVLGTPACRFYNPALANSITGMGREMLLWSKRWFEDAGFEVLYGDTDSLFVLSGMDDAAVAQERGRALAVALNRDIARHIEARWRVPSRLELEFEKLYLKLFLPSARHSTRGASKRYAGQLQEGGHERVEFVGMEVVRRDWTALAKQVQRELFERLFTGQRVESYLARVVEQVRKGELDEALVYRKNLRKDADEYTATTPPHVVAARKSNRSGNLISYVMTVAGPEPVDNVTHPLDREHYVAKQVRPVAEPVLAALGLDFDRVIGDDRQMDLLSALGGG